MLCIVTLGLRSSYLCLSVNNWKYYCLQNRVYYIWEIYTNTWVFVHSLSGFNYTFFGNCLRRNKSGTFTISGCEGSERALWLYVVVSRVNHESKKTQWLYFLGYNVINILNDPLMVVYFCKRNSQWHFKFLSLLKSMVLYLSLSVDTSQ